MDLVVYSQVNSLGGIPRQIPIILKMKEIWIFKVLVLVICEAMENSTCRLQSFYAVEVSNTIFKDWSDKIKVITSVFAKKGVMKQLCTVMQNYIKKQPYR